MALEDLDPEEEEDRQEAKEVEVIDEGESEPLPQLDDDSSVEKDSLIQPVDNIDEVVELYDQFEEIKSDLLDKDDITNIKGRIHVNKSGWRKIATAFNVSVEVVEENVWVDDGIVKAKVKAKATAPNGKESVNISMTASNESNFMDDDAPVPEKPRNDPGYLKIDGKWRRLKDPKEVNEHNILTMAATRAKNRAISDCVGGGDVSAEEIGKEDVL